MLGAPGVADAGGAGDAGTVWPLTDVAAIRAAIIKNGRIGFLSGT
jgi:hypothetical protein